MTGTDFHLSEALRAMVVRRLRLALSRFGGRVQKVTVHHGGTGEPLAGVDQRCRMRAWLQASHDVHAEAINGQIDAAADQHSGRVVGRA